MNDLARGLDRREIEEWTVRASSVALGLSHKTWVRIWGAINGLWPFRYGATRTIPAKPRR